MKKSSINRKKDKQIKWRADHPYHELPLLPPGTDLETRVVLKA